MLPLAAMAGFGLLQLAHEQRAQAERAGLEITRALATAVDAELGRSVSVLEGIARSPALDAGDLKGFHELMRRQLSTRPEWITITLAAPSGRLLANAEEVFGAGPATVAELPSLERAARTGQPAIGIMTRGPRGAWAVPVRVPVVRAEGVRYVLTAAVKPDAFVEVLTRQKLPADWVVSIFDTANQRVARSRRHADFLAQAPSPTLLRMMNEAKGDEASGLTQALEGDSIYTAFTRSRETGWSVAIGIPSSLVDAGVLRSLGAYGAGVLLSLALGLVAAWLAVRAASAADAEREALLRREREARAAAEAANRAKDEFLAMLGHELRNPLGALSNASRLLQHPRADAQAQGHAREIVARQVENLSRLTDDLLDAGRAMLGKIALERRPVDLAAAAGAALGMLRASGRLAAHRVHEHLSPAWVNADQTRLEQVVANLVGNAVKYTPAGGSITVRTGRIAADAVLTVTDDGAGLPPELLPRVFDPFVQGERDLDRAQGGLGIGLTLVRRLAELHGGYAVASSEGAGRGSEFRVHLPAIEPPAAAPPPEKRAASAGARDIVLVEDNADAAESLRGLLEAAGHRVRVARDGPAGLAALGAAPADAALIDIGLPGLDGYEIARRVRSGIDGRPAPLLIALTGYGLPEDRSRALAAGFDAHLVKPVDIEALEALLARPR